MNIDKLNQEVDRLKLQVEIMEGASTNKWCAHTEAVDYGYLQGKLSMLEMILGGRYD